jgi:carbon-monoxide dehydrogenase medium subunit
MYSVNYVKAKSVKEAAEFVARNPEAKLLAGGMTLIPTLKARLARPTHLVDIASLPELRRIEARGGKLVIGAGTKHHEVATSAVVKKAIPALAGLAGAIGDPQVRNRGTIGGSLANNDPAADYPAAVLGLGATVVTTKRSIAADDFFQGLFTTALEEGEVIVRIEFPLPKRAAYSKFHHPASGYAMAGVFIVQTAGGVRVAVTGAGPGVFRWKEAEAALPKGFKPAALEGVKLDASGLNNDIHADREYRANLVRVMAKRALAKLSGKSNRR